MYEKLSPAEEVKLTIIENFINHYFHEDGEQKDKALEEAFRYVTEDHVNELSPLLSTKREYQNW